MHKNTVKNKSVKFKLKRQWKIPLKWKKLEETTWGSIWNQNQNGKFEVWLIYERFFFSLRDLMAQMLHKMSHYIYYIFSSSTVRELTVNQLTHFIVAFLLAFTVNIKCKSYCTSFKVSQILTKCWQNVTFWVEDSFEMEETGKDEKAFGSVCVCVCDPSRVSQSDQIRSATKWWSRHFVDWRDLTAVWCFFREERPDPQSPPSDPCLFPPKSLLLLWPRLHAR